MVKLRKVVAMFLIFTMTFSNFAFVAKSFAATGVSSLFGTNTEEDAVKFEAYFSNKDEESEAVICDVNDSELNLKLKLQVQNGGYLKDGEVEFKSKDNDELNFGVKEENNLQEQENVQSLENNTLKLNKIENSSGEVELSIPIEYVMEEYIKETKLDSKTIVTLKGTYVDNKGEENDISKEIELELAWKDERELTVDTEVSKYINYGEGGIILQTVVRVDRTNENAKSLPIDKTELAVEIPKVNGTSPTDITIVANSTMGTNGKGIGELEFNTDNWSYNAEENMINIQVKNEKREVDVSNKEEYLKEENEEQKLEERYYSKAGIDEYLITYSFRNVEMSDEMEVTSNVSSKITLLNNNQKEITAESSKVFKLTGQTGNIVSCNVENETNDVSKVYAYLNKENEYKSKTAINISYSEIVEEIIIEDIENYYIDKAENKVAVDDMYYKNIVINKDNFIEILGENGYITVLDAEGNELVTINNETEVNEEGNYVVNFENKISRIMIKTSKPENTGNLVISNTKATSGTAMNKEDYANISYIATDTSQKAKFTYVSDYVDLGSCTVKTILNDTTTDINVVIDKDSLSTVTTNSNVEMRIELNNDEETSDVYGNSIFEVEMPEYVTNVGVTNASIIYGEGLEISNVSTYEKNGKVVVGIETTGQQTDLNSGVLTNGTNIVLNTDIDVNMFAPSKETTITTHVYNSNATNYANASNYMIGNAEVTGYEETGIEYLAPYGVITVNTLSNYESTGKTITSIKQGEKTDYIDIYTQAQNSTMEIAVMNNYENPVSDVAILGRVPFKGVKDIKTDKELKTTIDTKLISTITKEETTVGNFIIYYSENGEATKDLADSSNGWTKEPTSLEDVKSYMIVPEDTSYVLEPEQVLRFTYEYEIPENLEHNEYIYGTVATSYVLDETEEISVADKVGLTTGVGPNLEVSVETDKNTIKSLDNMMLTVKVKNTGEDIARDITLNVPIPEIVNYISAEKSNSLMNITLSDGVLVGTLSELAAGSELELNINFEVNETSKYAENSLEFTVTVSAKDLKKEVTATSEKIEIKKSELELEQIIDLDDADTICYESGMQVNVMLYAKNRTSSKISDVVVETQLPEEIEFVEAYMLENIEEAKFGKVNNAKYDSSTHKITWNIDEIDAKSIENLELIVKIGNLAEGLTGKNVEIKSQISANDTDTYKARDIILNMGKSSLSITQTTTTSTYITEGDAINYIFTISNQGSGTARNVLLTDLVPEGVVIKKISYVLEGEEVVSAVSETERLELELSVPGNTVVDVNVMALAEDLEEAQEKTVTNEATLEIDNTDTIESNSVTHIVKAIEDDDETDSTSTNNGVVTNNGTSTGDITKSYKISGTAWLDSNENGMRDDNEKKLSNITAILVDSSSGVIKSTTKTGNNGEYTFGGVENGSYLVIFKYDTVLYTVTTYRKEGIDSKVNSDAVTTKIEQDGKEENGAVTDVVSVNGTNVSNIDLGLVEAEKFSLGLDKSISKVTVQNSQGTKTEEFEDNTKLAQSPIKAKYVSETTVYVEYKITVTNNGDVEGYASEIVDYIPEGMTFNSNLNSDWYTGTDGNLYTKALANTELKPGESKTVTIVLTRKMNSENTDIVSNTAEISKDYNVYGISDSNSTPANKAQGEDDMSTADVIVTVSTGGTLIYTSVIIISFLIAGAVVFGTYKAVKLKRKGGV